ncbi:MAG: hypothetical protein ACYDEQ_03930, partial [Desulfocucumaceae bacterium]
MTEPFFFYIKDSVKNNEYEEFILHNFGILSSVVSMELAYRDVPHEIIESNNISPEQLFDKLLNCKGRIVVPIDLCEKYVPLNDSTKYSSFSDGFHLVVGNSPMDMIYSWNRTSKSEPYYGRTTFWLPEALCQNDNILNLLGKWIQQSYWNHHASEGKV